MKKTYIPRGVCSQRIDYDLENGIITDIKFYQGCDGSLKAIASLLRGMEKEKAISLLKGITCGKKSTSCADQLAIALEKDE